MWFWEQKALEMLSLWKSKPKTDSLKRHTYTHTHTQKEKKEREGIKINYVKNKKENITTDSET